MLDNILELDGSHLHAYFSSHLQIIIIFKQNIGEVDTITI